MADLKPCPFCGSDQVKPDSTCPEDHFVYCLNCECEGPLHITPEPAIEAWNRRANLQASEPEQVQTAVGLPENFCATMPTGRGTGEETDELNIYVKCGTLLYTADQMESYATAKTAEAVRELVESLGLLVAGIENSVSPTYIPLKKARAVLAKYELSNGKA